MQVLDTIPSLDIAAAVSPDKSRVTFAMVNSSGNPISFSPDFGATDVSEQGTKWLIQHNDPEAYNVPGEAQEVEIIESDFVNSKNHIEVPAYSIMLIKLDLL